MERPSSPASNSPSMTNTSPPSSPTPSDLDVVEQQRQKKKTRKKRKQATASAAAAAAASYPEDDAHGEPPRKKKPKAKRGNKHETTSTKSERGSGGGGGGTASAAAESSTAAPVSKKARKQSSTKRSQVERSEGGGGGTSPAQSTAHDQMRKALEEDQYSAVGSIVDTDSDSDGQEFMIKGRSVRLDRNAILSAMRKRLWMERVAAAGAGANMTGMGGSSNNVGGDDEDLDEDTDVRRGGRKKKKKKGKRKDDGSTGGGGLTTDDDGMGRSGSGSTTGGDNWSNGPDAMDLDDPALDDLERDEGSIFGQTTGNSNSIWVECDKCKKWRRLRGVVDEKKLPSKWYCSMNKNDPERARCSAPEEEYDTANTPESAADARTRKHLRVWVRRLQCNEAYEARQPTLTRGKKRAAATSSKEPYEWIRCCNPSCGKWRAILRIMDAKNSVMDRTTDGEWYCVMNTWDEKTASCAAPQENLPAVGCPPWVMQEE